MAWFRCSLKTKLDFTIVLPLHFDKSSGEVTYELVLGGGAVTDALHCAAPTSVRTQGWIASGILFIYPLRQSCRAVWTVWGCLWEVPGVSAIMNFCERNLCAVWENQYLYLKWCNSYISCNREGFKGIKLYWHWLLNMISNKQKSSIK